MPTIRVPAELCTRCKGYRRLCGLPECPLLQRFRAQIYVARRLRGRETAGSTPPTVIVGEKGYPRVSLFYSVPPNVFGEEAKIYDDPVNWWGKLGLDQILELRSSMVTGFDVLHIQKDLDKLYRSEIAFAAVSTKPVDSEIKLKYEPIPRIEFSDRVKPLSLIARAEDIRVTSNPRVDRALDKVYEDDVPAFDAIVELYRRGVDVYTIQRALSLGLLGRKLTRKLVPTRWAITAVDRTISRYLLSQLRGSDTVNTSTLYYVEYLGNRFWILIEPGKYEVIWIEVWHPSSFYHMGDKVVTIYNKERISGNVEFMDGGFEAAKLGVLEHLYRLGRQAKVYIVREVLPSYYAPVGNWHIRESVRRALGSNPIAQNITVEEAIEIISQTSAHAAEALKNLITKTCVLSLNFFIKRS